MCMLGSRAGETDPSMYGTMGPGTGGGKPSF